MDMKRIEQSESQQQRMQDHENYNDGMDNNENMGDNYAEVVMN